MVRNDERCRTNRRYVFLGAITGIAVLFFSSSAMFAQGDCGGTTHTITLMDPDTFVPANITVEPGDTVEWVWTDLIEPHTITSQLSGIDCNDCPAGGGGPCGTLFDESNVIGTGTISYQIPANQTADIPYICRIHCAVGMTGIITVDECLGDKPVPAISAWGVLGMVLLVATAGTIGVRRRQTRMTA